MMIRMKAQVMLVVVVVVGRPPSSVRLKLRSLLIGIAIQCDLIPRRGAAALEFAKRRCRLIGPVWREGRQSCTLPARMRTQAVLLLVVVVVVLALAATASAGTFPLGRRCKDGESWNDGCNDCFCSNGVPACTLRFCPEEGYDQFGRPFPHRR
ncbi:hypothetical protein O3P69_014667 [Scylla paramamosain]|uniref:Pacifastin domain-containing protein n=1 Tax=Scylla paramamosain TaxID=85552 RepID=A0AAW0TY50_SCYPA